MKKSLFATLALASVVSICLAVASCGIISSDNAPSDDTLDDTPGSPYLKYEAVEDGFAVVGVEEDFAETDLVIPSTHDGKKVTEVAYTA